MQPRPMAETSGPLAPNRRIFIGWLHRFADPAGKLADGSPA